MALLGKKKSKPNHKNLIKNKQNALYLVCTISYVVLISFSKVLLEGGNKPGKQAYFQLMKTKYTVLLHVKDFYLVSINGRYTKSFQHHLKYFYHSLDFFNC